MLDDQNYIAQLDAQGAFGIAADEWKQLAIPFESPQHVLPPSKINNIVYAAMGGSALAATLSQSWPGYTVPFEICRNYDIPAYVTENTLFIAASYSGNTEETISAIEQAEKRGAQIAVIAGGGKLEDIAREKKYPLYLLPKAEQPRFAVLANLKALVSLLESYSLVNTASAEHTINQTAEYIKASVGKWLPEVPTAENPAKQLAMELAGKSPVIYAGPFLSPAEYKWKISFNENAKNVAWYGQLPEFNHNEFIGWSSHPKDKPYAVIELRSTFEHPRVQKRFEVGGRLLEGMRPEPVIVEARGKTKLEQLLWTVVFGDFVSLYLAILNGVNPSPVGLVEQFKKELG